MSILGLSVSDLLFKLRLKDERIEALESGEAYVRMKEQCQEELRFQDRRIRQLEQALATEQKQNTENRKNWEQVYDDIIAEYEKKLAEKDRQYEKVQNENQTLKQEKAEQKKKENELRKELYAVKTELEDVKNQMAALEARVNKDHTNSGKPSSQAPNHPPIPNGREKTGRKPGGQPGHPHHGRKRVKNPSRKIILPPPQKVIDQPDRYEKKPVEEALRRQLIKLKVVVEAIDYVAEVYVDRMTGEELHAPFPVGIDNDVNYDSTIKAFAFLLNQECNVSIGKTRAFIRDITHGILGLSTGMICDLAKEFSEKTEEERAEIIQQILASGTIHADYTFARKKGKIASVLIYATKEGASVYQSVPAKGYAGIDHSPLKDYHGIMIHDHESAFVNSDVTHQECIGHVKRYIVGSILNEKGLSWNKRMKDWIKRAVQHHHNYDPETESEWRKKSEDLIRELEEIMAKAKEEYEDGLPNPYYREGYNLYLRISGDIDHYTLFLRDPSVPPTNNMAERKARKFKRKAHQVMSFRGNHGDEYCCDGLTITETLKSEGENLFDGITERFDNPEPVRRKTKPAMLEKIRSRLTRHIAAPVVSEC